MFLDKLGNPGYLTVAEDALVLEHRVAIALDKELGGTAFGELAVAGMDVHALDHAEGREIMESSMSSIVVSSTSPSRLNTTALSGLFRLRTWMRSPSRVKAYPFTIKSALSAMVLISGISNTHVFNRFEE